MKKLFYKIWRFLIGKSTSDFIVEFYQKFPDKCYVCSHHRYGINNGFTTDETPLHYPCRERKNI